MFRLPSSFFGMNACSAHGFIAISFARQIRGRNSRDRARARQPVPHREKQAQA